ncbi:DUF4037 domain-containing protein [Saccharopolyspora indica]|uniref:DUF4037 domain-containing protein n=1 Tax=Saccharopolyspora indica TaxID=1229659 RepID=UPI0022EA73D5|nr:DUF4037 domain-containing protein [Saccharopolyspora indica]MDA3647340.1 DUF4037 domain-containing protein [Saccharopolyspora indica]
MADFIPGLALARSFYTDVVAALLDMPHSACLIGEGSEVLGYDTPRSTDHEWGPRAQIFVAADQVDRARAVVSAGLPAQHRGHPTAWYSLAEQRVAHHVEIAALDDWLTARLGLNPLAGLDHAAWLALPQQHLLQLTSGAVFRDDSGELTRLREVLRWYPDDVWRWLLAAQWHLIGNAEPLLGRVRETGDELGTRLIEHRLCRLITEMAFLQEKRYRPYDKWFGAAFAELRAAATLGPLIDDVLGGAPGSLPVALIELAERHNDLGIADPVTPVVADFDVGINGAVRPHPVLNSGDFVTATTASITDPALRSLIPVGAIDQLTHTDDALINFSGWPQSLAGCYRAMLSDSSG